jgi:cytochrome c heme-lyase
MSACPVPHESSGSSDGKQDKQACPVGGDVDKSSGLLGWLHKRSSSSSTSSTGTVSGAGGGTPIPSNAAGAGGAYNAPANDEAFGQERQVNQALHLSQRRSLSGIPKGEFTPAHQRIGDKNDESEKSKNWIYPSEQQYFNAMKKKGYNPQEHEVGSILAIHNVVNERSWSEIVMWEMFRGNKNPTLVRFMGKPKEFSPKAQFLTFIGRPAPFDRHDWIVDRDGQEVRYVIDFYEVQSRNKKAQSSTSVPIHLDVRPALDSVGSVLDRIEYQFRKTFLPATLPTPKR